MSSSPPLALHHATTKPPPSAAADKPRHSLAQILADKYAYTQLDSLEDTKYARVDPMNRFQQLHRQFVRQQQARGHMVQHEPAQQLPAVPAPATRSASSSSASAASLRARDPNATQAAKRTLNAASAKEIIADEAYIRDRIQDAESSWRRMIDLRVFEVRKASAAYASQRATAKETRAQRCAAALVNLVKLEEDTRRQLQAGAHSLHTALITSASVRQTRLDGASKRQHAEVQSELGALPTLEQQQRQLVEYGNDAWRTQAANAFRARRAALQHALSLKHSEVTLASQLKRLGDGERFQRVQLEASETMRRQAICGAVNAHRLARQTMTLVSSQTVSQRIASLLREIKQQEAADRAAVEAAEHGWWRCIADAHIRDTHRLAIEASRRSERVVTPLQVVDFTLRERAGREDIISSEERHRLVLLQWAIVNVENHQRPQSSESRSGVRVSAATADCVNQDLVQSAALQRARKRDFASELWLITRDEESMRMQIVQREVQWRQFGLSSFRRQGVEVADAIAHQQALDQRRRDAEAVEHEWIFREEEKARGVLLRQEAAKYEYFCHLVAARTGALPETLLARIQKVVQEEHEQRVQIEYAQDRWRAFVLLQHQPPARKAALSAAPSAPQASAPIRLDELARQQ